MDFTLTEEQQELAGPGHADPRRPHGRSTHLRELDEQRGLVRPRDVGRARQGEPARRRAARGRRRPRLRLPRAVPVLQEQGRDGGAAAAPPHAVSRARCPSPSSAPTEQREDLGAASSAATRSSPPRSTSSARPADEPQTIAERAGRRVAARRARRSACRRRTSPTASSCRPASARTSGCSSSSPNADGVTLERQDDDQPRAAVRGAARRRRSVSDAAPHRRDRRRSRQPALDPRPHRSSGICAIVAGACQEALRITAEYTTERKQFDRAIGTFQAVGQRMADCLHRHPGDQAHDAPGRDAPRRGRGRRRPRWRPRSTGRPRAAAASARRAARARRHQHRPRLPDPPLLPVGQAARVHPGRRRRRSFGISAG